MQMFGNKSVKANKNDTIFANFMLKERNHFKVFCFSPYTTL